MACVNEIKSLALAFKAGEAYQERKTRVNRAGMPIHKVPDFAEWLVNYLKQECDQCV